MLKTAPSQCALYQNCSTCWTTCIPVYIKAHPANQPHTHLHLQQPSPPSSSWAPPAEAAGSPPSSAPPPSVTQTMQHPEVWRCGGTTVVPSLWQFLNLSTCQRHSLSVQAWLCLLNLLTHTFTTWFDVAVVTTMSTKTILISACSSGNNKNNKNKFYISSTFLYHQYPPSAIQSHTTCTNALYQHIHARA